MSGSSEATPTKPHKRRRRDTDHEDEKEMDGSEYTDPHRCIQLQSNETTKLTIRQRRYWEFETTSDAKTIYVHIFVPFFVVGISCEPGAVDALGTGEVVVTDAPVFWLDMFFAPGVAV